MDTDAKDYTNIQVIGDSVKAGMAPFKPGDIIVEVEETIPGYKVTVEVANIPQARASFIIDPASLAQPDAKDMLEFLGHKFFNFFRENRTEAEDNVELGDY